MRYIIMCGGTYTQWTVPRQLIEIRGEPIVARTIRLLRENGIEDIAISSNNPIFDGFGVTVLHHDNGYNATGFHNFTGYWADGFYPTDDPVCYLFGDVVFSPEAIRTIIRTDTRDVMFFCISSTVLAGLSQAICRAIWVQGSQPGTLPEIYRRSEAVLH